MNEINSNKNIYSWLPSGISLVMSVFAWIFFLFRNFAGLILGAVEKSWFNVMFLYFLVALVLGIIGLIAGIRQRKEGTRKSAILGIIIPIIAIMLSLVVGFSVELSIILRST